MLTIQKFIKDHPENWEQKLNSKPYCLKISKDLGVICFSYNMLDSDFSQPIVKEARGLCLYESTFEVACHSFDKFFNYGESNAAVLEWKSVKAQEKIDGTLMKLWFNKVTNSWVLSTNKTIDAKKAPTADVLLPTFYDVFQEALKNNDYTWETFIDIFLGGTLDNNTYTFELVSPQTRVVIPYEKPDIYFIGCRDNNTNEEFSPAVFDFLSHIKRPKEFIINDLQTAVDLALTLPWDKEGYVVVDSNFNRVKVKSTEWVKAHYCRNNNVINQKFLVQIILEGEQDEFLTYAKDYEEQLKATQEKMNRFYDMLANSFYSLFDAEPDSPRDYAQKVKKQPGIVQDYLFRMKRGEFVKMYCADWNASKWCDILEQLPESQEES